MNTFFAFIPLVAIIAFLVLRIPSSVKASKSEGIDIIMQGSDSIHEEEISVGERPSLDSGRHEYEVVVKVVVEGAQVGYIAKSDSGTVTVMTKKRGKTRFEEPAQIGFDPNSPSPLIGVRLALTLT